MANRAGLGGVAVVTLGALVAACLQCGGGKSDSTTGPIVLALMDAMKPNGGSVSGYSGLRYDRAGVHASWEVEPGMDWPAYAAWLTENSPAGFTAEATADASALVLRKTAAADAYSVRLEPIPASLPVRVRATFAGHPF